MWRACVIIPERKRELIACEQLFWRVAKGRGFIPIPLRFLNL